MEYREGWEDLPEVREELEYPPAGPGGVKRPSWKSGRVGRLSRRSGRGWLALADIWYGSGGPPTGPGGVGRPSWCTRRCREALTEVMEALP